MIDTERRKSYVGYEYKEIYAEGSKASFMVDGYECFGWEVDDNLSIDSRNQYGAAYSSKALIRMKRNRKIVNKMELTRLQRNFEACVKEIEMLENSKTSRATIYALVIGIIGTAFVAGSVFAITAQPPYIALCIILAIPGFVGWILPIFVYRKVMKQQIERLTPLIEQKFDEIYELCEKGSKLLY